MQTVDVAVRADAVAFADVWQRSVSSRPDQTFLVFEGSDGHVAEWTYAEFDVTVGRVARTMRRHGVERGRAVHLALANSPAFVAAWLAAVRLGAWIVPRDPAASEAELATHIRHADPALAICSATNALAHHASADGLATLEVDERDVDLAVFGQRELGDWPVVNGEDRAAVVLRSAAAGAATGVEITQASYAFAGEVMAEATGLQPVHRQIVAMPMFRPDAQWCVAATIWAGAEVVLLHAFAVVDFVEQARRHRATHASLDADSLRAVLARGITDRTSPARLAHCGYTDELAGASASAISDDEHLALEQILGCRPTRLDRATATIAAALTEIAPT